MINRIEEKKSGPLWLTFDLVFVLSHHQATGDIRPNGDRYIYHIQLSGITNDSLSSCVGANICQVKLNGAYNRRIGSSSKAKYYIKGDLLLGFVSHF